MNRLQQLEFTEHQSSCTECGGTGHRMRPRRIRGERIQETIPCFDCFPENFRAWQSKRGDKVTHAAANDSNGESALFEGLLKLGHQQGWPVEHAHSFRLVYEHGISLLTYSCEVLKSGASLREED